jgi:hypothetical protein
VREYRNCFRMGYTRGGIGKWMPHNIVFAKKKQIKSVSVCSQTWLVGLTLLGEGEGLIFLFV